MKYNLITILGPTAVGKTRLGALLANASNGEIISADSRQVYLGMDIGTGKDIDDYKVDKTWVPFHLVDIIDPKEEFNLFSFNNKFFNCFNDINSRNKIPFLVGGTGLFIDSVLSKYKMVPVNFESERANELAELENSELVNILLKLKPGQHNSTDLKLKDRIIKAILIAEAEKNGKSPDRPEINSLVIGVSPERQIIKERITKRLKERLKTGMIEEVETLLSRGVAHEKLQFFGLEYKFLSLYLLNELNYNDMFQKLNSSIHKFAKRQMTFFRKMEKQGVKINWIDGPDFEAATKLIETNYK